DERGRKERKDLIKHMAMELEIVRSSDHSKEQAGSRKQCGAKRKGPPWSVHLVQPEMCDKIQTLGLEVTGLSWDNQSCVQKQV
ncbi:hypothetical protein NPIL_651141, partial [Nephila pilipes]